MTPWKTLVGQDQAVSCLQRALHHKEFAPAYLFVGAEGVGKRFAARIFIEHLQGTGMVNHPNVLWLEPTYSQQGELISQSQVEASQRTRPPRIRAVQVRRILQFLSQSAFDTKPMVVVIEDAPRLTQPAAEALLKALEEPGEGKILLLLATAPDELPATIVSRCALIPFHRLSPKAMNQVLQQQGVDLGHNPTEILAMAAGSPGSAIAISKTLSSLSPELLDQLHAFLVPMPMTPSLLVSCLNLARTLEETFDYPQQVCLLDYLQYLFWQRERQPELLSHLEKAKHALARQVQKRLVWEMTLINLKLSQGCRGVGAEAHFAMTTFPTSTIMASLLNDSRPFGEQGENLLYQILKVGKKFHPCQNQFSTTELIKIARADTWGRGRLNTAINQGRFDLYRTATGEIDWHSVPPQRVLDLVYAADCVLTFFGYTIAIDVTVNREDTIQADKQTKLKKLKALHRQIGIDCSCVLYLQIESEKPVDQITTCAQDLVTQLKSVIHGSQLIHLAV